MAAGTKVAAADPTANVLLLLNAESRRQDNLRAAEMRHVQEIASLRAEHAKEIRYLESDRLEKIRQVDVLAGNTAAERALVAIQTLATSQAAERETLRSMVANTATTIAAQLATTVATINERIAQLERSSYEGKGKQMLTDPLMERLVNRMEGLLESRAGGVGVNVGKAFSWERMVSVVGLLGSLVAIFLVFSK